MRGLAVREVAMTSSIRVYRYGITAPYESAALVYEQMRLAHAYRNTLVEIERGRRAAVRALENEDIRRLTAGVAQADAACQTLAAEIKKVRAESRKRSEGTTLREKLLAAREHKRLLTTTLYAVRREHAAKTRDAADIIGERAKELQRSARAHCGVYWGTYLLVEEAAQASAQAPLYELDGVTPHDPKFLRWTGDAEVGVQIQVAAKGAISAVVGETHSQLRITEPPGAWSHPCRSERVRLARNGELAMRIGSDGQAPIWARWRLDMHRPLPAGATVKTATVHVRQRGPHLEWYLTVTLQVPYSAVVPSTSGGEAVGIDVGWRVLGEEIRVAVAHGASGDRTELRLDAPTLRLLRSPSRLRAERDLKFESIKARMRLASKSEGAPEWLQEAGKVLHAWRSPKRMVMLHAHWMEHRFPGDDGEFGQLEAWWWTDRHLWAAEAEGRLQGLRRRKNIYRVFAAKLATKYDALVLERFDLRKIARREPTSEETGEKDNKTALSNRHLVAVSELRAAILGAAQARGREVVAVDAADTTHICHVCGLVGEFDAAEHVRHTCECGAEWDQDENAASVLLARWRERPGDAKVLVPARVCAKLSEEEVNSETRYQRVRRLRMEKVRRMEAAREAACMGAE